MPDHVEQIKSKLDVVEVIAGYIKVQKAGANFKARCPFHNEKTPSFHFSPERQIWHCFGCGKGGDMFTFVQEIEGIEFPDALRILAQKSGVQLDAFQGSTRNAKTPLYEISELATKFFEKQLWFAGSAQSALAYLHERGLTDETIKEFRLGFAPNDWQALGNFLQASGYSRKDIVAAGLAIEREGRQYDRFRSRITFPIFDVSGQVVGFTGRIFGPKPAADEPEPAKYINTPQTLIYDKSTVLYGLSKAKTEAKQHDRCLLVEGNMDAIMSYQAGTKHVVATSGTALTPGHLKLLQRYTTNLDFCFDTDQADALATRRAIGLALSQSLNVRVVAMIDPECKDPADYVKKNGAAWNELAASAKPVIQFYFDKARVGYQPNDVASKKSMIATLAPLLQRLTSRVEQAHWINQLASLLHVDEAAVEADVRAAKDDLGVYQASVASPASVGGAQAGEPASAPALPHDILSEALLSVVMKNPVLFRQLISEIDRRFLHPRVAEVLEQLAASDPQTTSVDQFIKSHNYGTYTLEFAYLRSQELWQGISDQELRAEFYHLLQKIKQRAVMTQLSNLEFDIKEAEVRQDGGRVQELAREFTTLTQELAQIQKV